MLLMEHYYLPWSPTIQAVEVLVVQLICVCVEGWVRVLQDWFLVQ
jgi:hypothetical protein